MLDEEARGLDLGGAPRRRGGGGGGRRGAIYHLSIRTASRAKDNSARASAAYIQREAEYGREAQEDELVHAESGHMPAWAEAEPAVYWEAADQHERANGRLFKRLEFALPLALSAADRADLAVGFAHSLTDAERLPYTLAIHAGDGENPHCHLMISERGNDGIERSPAQWFKRYNAAEPEQGGARKSEALKPRAWFDETRAAWADQTNAALERAGHDVRIDHRSLADQGIEDRLPGVHLGPNVVEMEARGIETDKGNAARETDRANAELAGAARKGGAAREERAAVIAAQEQEPAARARPSSQWETVKARVGAWFSRDAAPEALPTPPPAQEAPSPAQDGPRPSSPASDQAGAENAPERPVSVAEEAAEAMRRLKAAVRNNYEAVAAQVAAVEDPRERAALKEALETIRHQEADRQRWKEERAREQAQERGRGRDDDFDLER